MIVDLVGSASVQVSWGAGINGPGTQYSAQISTESQFLSGISTVTVSSALSKTFTGLSPNAVYYLRASNNDWTAYTSEFSSTTLVTLPAQASPQAFSNVAENAVTANWGDGGNPAGTQYRIEVSSTGGAIAQSPWQTAFSCNFTDLMPNVTYYFNAKGRNSALAEGGFVSLSSTVTLAASPPAPVVSGGSNLAEGNYLRVTPSYGINHSLTELSIQNSNGQFLQGDGTTATTEVWKTRADWESGFAVNIEKVPANLGPQQYKVYVRNFRGLKNTTPSNLTLGSSFAVESRFMVDTDGDGVGDAVKLTFSQEAQDSSIVPGQFSIAGPGGTASKPGVRILTGISGDAVNDKVIYLDVGNAYASNEEPLIQHTGTDGLKALSGGALGPESAGNNAFDRVAPVLTRVQTVSRNGQTTLLATFSEQLTVQNPLNWEIESPLGTPIPLANAGWSYQNGDKAVKISLSVDLSNGSQVKVKARNISDTKGNSRGESSQTGAILTNVQNFIVTEYAPGRRAKGSAVDAAAKIIIFFDREMDAASVQSGISLYQIGDKLGNSVQTAISGTMDALTGNQMFKFIPASPLPKGSKFRVVMDATIKDAFGFSSGAESSWEFSTAADYTERTVTNPAPGFKFVIPPGTFSQDAGLTVATDPASNAAHTDKSLIQRALNLELRKAERAGSITHSPIPSLTFEIVGETPQGGLIQGALGNAVTLTLSYPDADNDGIVDGTTPGVPAKDLALYFLDETLGEFRKIPSQVDTGAKTISASLSHFSIYAVMGALSTTVDSFLVRPNPWEPGKDPLPIILDNLPDPAEISIYSVTGQKVATLQGNGDSAIEWFGANDSGEPLGSGVYIAILKSGSGSKSKKLTIIR